MEGRGDAAPIVRLRAIAFIESGAAGRRPVEDAVTRHGGEVVQIRDGLVIATFESAPASVGACLQLDADVRAGVSCGDILYDSGLVQGLPVVEASRLKDHAQSGEVLCSARFVAVSGQADRFRGIGPLELKGLAAPLIASRLVRS